MDCANPDCMNRAGTSLQMHSRATNEVQTMYFCEPCAEKVLAGIETHDEPPVNRAAKRRNEARSRKRQAQAALN